MAKRGINPRTRGRRINPPLPSLDLTDPDVLAALSDQNVRRPRGTGGPGSGGGGSEAFTISNEMFDVFAAKTSSEQRSASTTLTEDADLTVPVVAGRIYAFELFMALYIPIGAGLKWSLPVPGLATSDFQSVMWYFNNSGTPAASSYGSLVTHDDVVTMTDNFNVGNQGTGYIRGEIAPTASGNFVLSWAPNVVQSPLDGPTILFGYLGLKRVA